MIYQVTDTGQLEPGWYVQGQEHLGPSENRQAAVAAALKHLDAALKDDKGGSSTQIHNQIHALIRETLT
jgi:hypothetical protein